MDKFDCIIELEGLYKQLDDSVVKINDMMIFRKLIDRVDECDDKDRAWLYYNVRGQLKGVLGWQENFVFRMDEIQRI